VKSAKASPTVFTGTPFRSAKRRAKSVLAMPGLYSASLAIALSISSSEIPLNAQFLVNAGPDAENAEVDVAVNNNRTVLQIRWTILKCGCSMYVV